MRRRSAVVWAVAVFFCTTVAAQERPDLLPQKVRWQAMPADVLRVTVDAGGRAWFEVAPAGPASVEPPPPSVKQVQAAVEGVAALPAPWLTGARIVLHDARGRIWLVPDLDAAVQVGAGEYRFVAQR